MRTKKRLVIKSLLVKRNHSVIENQVIGNQAIEKQPIESRLEKVNPLQELLLKSRQVSEHLERLIQSQTVLNVKPAFKTIY
jgi:hypothetical protein